jgi:RNA polymerase sigma-70 factor (family 1)
MRLNKKIYRLEDVDDDRAILAKLSEGHEQAFAVIYNKYWKMVYHTADKFLQSSTHAQDVVQEVFSTIWSQRQDFGDVENLQAYIRTMTRNRIYSELRVWSREKKDREAYLVQTETSVNDSDFNILDSQNEQLLEQILHSLPPRQQEVFNLARKEGLSHEKIAEKLNLSTGTVKNHMVRALNAIRSQITPHLSTKLFLSLFF